MGLLVVLGCNLSFDAKPVQSPQKLTLAGKLVQVFAVGGETTGWALELGEAREIENNNIRSLELDPAPHGLRFDSFNGKQVEVTGFFQWREGVERKRYLVLIVETIVETTREQSGSEQRNSR